MSSLIHIATAAFTGGVSVLSAYGAIRSAGLKIKRDAVIQAVISISCAGFSGSAITLAALPDSPKPAAPSAQGAVIRIPGEIPQVTTVPLPVEKKAAPAVML